MKTSTRFLLRAKGSPRHRGFALVVSLSLMVLLTVLAVGLLTLSAVSLRSSSSGDAKAEAYANARLAVMMAVSQLQKQAGDDRRITADASMVEKAPQPNLVGVYNSWSHNFISQPDRSIPGSQYTTQKNNTFKGWLASSPNPVELKDKAWGDTAPDDSWAHLFTPEENGFELRAPMVEMPTGSLAWAVVQENTKAKVTVAGPDEFDDLPENAILQAQPRPSLEEAAEGLKNPKKGWNARSGRVISMNQIGLDTELSDNAEEYPGIGRSYTVHSQGLLTDAVLGGLKVDLNLGFELSDGDFTKTSWGGVPNPFRGTKAKAGFAAPASFKGQMPLFRPLVGMDNPLVTATVNYDVATVSERFYGAAVPTFDHLRSYYRVAHHLYGGQNPPTVAERSVDHVAAALTNTAGSKPSPSRPPRGLKSVTSIKPVLNRMVYLLSATVKDGAPQLVITPVIALWNPYNVMLEIEGAVAYPWIDVPFHIQWTFSPKRVTYDTGAAMSQLMGKQFQSQNHGRQINPYFLCQITAGGTGSVTSPIRFEPGEVRLFAPASPTPVNFVRDSQLATKTIKMRPVEDVNQFSTKGGLVVPMKAGGQGFDYKMMPNDKATVEVRESNPGAYHYFMTLEDATRIKTNVPEDAVGGQATGDVQMLSFVSTANKVVSPNVSYEALQQGTVPFGVLESFHRTAIDNVGSQPVADLLYTTNPRNPSITHLLAPGTFSAAPHYQTTLRAVSSFNGAIQTTPDGRNSFWGNSHTSRGKYHLPFFDLPRQPMLSLANFQNADLAASPYAPAHQFANSWASAWVTRNKAASRIQPPNVQSSVPVYDTSFLVNEALWDGYFFSGAAPTLTPGNSSTQVATAWDNDQANPDRDVDEILKDFLDDPMKDPLSNPRMRLHMGGRAKQELLNELKEPAGCAKIAAHLTVDGAFNINSTDVDAWVAVLSGLRGQSFDMDGSSSGTGSATPFPRFRSPTGSPGDNWSGFRTLDDTEIRKLAENIVVQVRRRGPFLSLAEFVNRRIESSDLGRSGALQSAIDASSLNGSSKQSNFATTGYPAEARSNIVPNDTGVGIPGYLTQADLLQSLAPVITCRSDTFTVRGYGEAKDQDGNVVARAWCEAVVQRVPEFVDPTDPAYSAIADLSEVNQTFGRRFEIVSFRQIPRPELKLKKT